MPSLNSFQPPVKPAPALYHLDTPADQYDQNFMFAIPDKLESNGVELVPFVPSVHGRMIHELIKGPPGDAVYRYLPYGPFPELEQFLTWVETMIRRDPASLLFVMVDKTWSLAAGTAQLNGAASKSTLPPPTPLAGMLAYRTSSVDTLHIEIGHVAILPHFQRSHIATHSIGLMLQYAFDVLRLWRVSWVCHSANMPSRLCAERMGLRFEGILRWDRILAPHKEEIAGLRTQGRPRPDHKCRMTALLAECWDDWEEYGRELARDKMARTLPVRTGTYVDWIASPR